MRAYIVRRLLLVPLILLGVSILTFTLVRVLPGDAALTRLGATGQNCAECRAKVTKALGLDKPAPVQYLNWLGDALHGDFGLSVAQNQPIAPQLRDRLFNTVQLAVLAVLLTVLIGVPVGAISALRPGTKTDYLARFLSILGLSIPDFWIGTLVVLMPAIWWHWTPVKQFVSLQQNPLKHVALLLLPALVLSIGASAYVARLVRSSMLEVLTTDHVRTARSKGLHERTVVYRHVFRNSLVTVLTVIGLQFGLILGGSIVIESIFSIPGIGSMVADAVFNRDYPVVQASAVVIAAGFMLITLAVDISYAWIDPRIRY